MPILHFIKQDREIVAKNCSIDIPQEIIDEGEEEIKQYIMENDHAITEIDTNTKYSEVTDSLYDIVEIDLNYKPSTKITVTFEYDNACENSQTKTDLALHALERSINMIRQGYCQGELMIEYNYKPYNGWWKIQ